MGKGSLWQLITVMSIVSLIAVGLCGCGGGGGVAVTTGSVAGQVLHLTTDVGLGGVILTVGGRSTQSESNGDFLITGITPAQGQELTVTPQQWVQLPGAPEILVNVYGDQTTTLPAPIRLIDASDLPPDPPS